jgi:ubiquinol-cytochrome c reductase cytochrome b/c1 subunit
VPLTSFLSLHYLLPFVTAFVVILHIRSLKRKGSLEGLSLRRDFLVKAGLIFAVFLIVYVWLVFYPPNVLGHADTHIKASSLQTPVHIVPEWYDLPFYAILRSVPWKLGGVIAMFGAVSIFTFLPWLDRAPAQSTRRPIFTICFWLFLACVLGLGYIGSQPPEGSLILAGQLLTFYYFLYFLVITPLFSRPVEPSPARHATPDSGAQFPPR